MNLVLVVLEVLFPVVGVHGGSSSTSFCSRPSGDLPWAFTGPRCGDTGSEKCEDNVGFLAD